MPVAKALAQWAPIIHAILTHTTIQSFRLKGNNYSWYQTINLDLAGKPVDILPATLAEHTATSSSFCNFFGKACACFYTGRIQNLRVVVIRDPFWDALEVNRFLAMGPSDSVEMDVLGHVGYGQHTFFGILSYF